MSRSAAFAIVVERRRVAVHQFRLGPNMRAATRLSPVRLINRPITPPVRDFAIV